MIIQLSGTSISQIPAPQHFDDERAIGDPNYILAITLPYYDIQSGTAVYPWVLRWYMNGACARPAVPWSHEFGIHCFYNTPTHSFSLTEVLRDMDNTPLFWSNYSTPTSTAENLTISTIATTPSFLLSVLGMLASALMVVASIFEGCKPEFKKGRTRDSLKGDIQILSLSGLATFCYLVTIAYLTSHAHSAVSMLHETRNLPYVSDIEVGKAFQGMGWGAVCAQGLATALFFWRYHSKSQEVALAAGLREGMEHDTEAPPAYERWSENGEGRELTALQPIYPQK